MHSGSHLFRRRGRDDLREQWHELWANFDKVGFLSEVGPVQVSGNLARARSVAREVIRLADGSIFKLIGIYDDELVRSGETWLFARRDYTPLVQEFPVRGSP